MTIPVENLEITYSQVGIDDPLRNGLDYYRPGTDLYFVVHEICSVEVVSVGDIRVAVYS